MHKAQNVIIACMDFRFQKAMQDYLNRNEYLGHTDEIIVAGAGRDLINPVADDDGFYLWKQLNLSIKLHDPENIIIFGHQDCGGWAQDGAIPNNLEREKDLSKHKEYWKSLKSKIKGKYPNKKVEFWYIDLEMKVEKIEV